MTNEERRFYAVLEQMTEDEYFELVEGIRRDEFPSMPEPPEKTGVYNTEPRYQFIPDEPEKTALYKNQDTDLIAWPQVSTYQLPF